MRELHFDVAGQLLRRNKQCDFENIVRGSDNYLCLVFHFDDEWKGTKRAPAEEPQPPSTCTS